MGRLKSKFSGHNGSVERLIDWSKMWAIIKKNWMVLRGDKVRLIPMIMFPLIMIVVFGYSSGNLPKHLPASVVDYDHSTLSQEVQDQIGGQELYTLRYDVGTQAEGKKLMDEGKIKVLFIIPAGFGDSVAAGRPAHIDLMVDESDSAVAQIAKSSAQVFVQKLSGEITARRLDAISAHADTARTGLDVAKNQLLATSSSSSASNDAALASAAALSTSATRTATASGTSIRSAVRDLQNSLGYLIDQNEVVTSFNPSSLGSAALAQLATGDAQQDTLARIAFYQGMGAAQAQLYNQSMGLYTDVKVMAAQSERQAASAQLSANLIDRSGAQLAQISNDAQTAPTPIDLSVLEPYGYGRKGIDFLLPSLLAMTIFMGASQGLGRAIAGERHDGSLTRVFLTPTSNVTIILGTQIFYLIFETIRSSLIIFVAMALFGVTISGAIPDIIFIIGLYALSVTGVGMVLSVMAQNQDQYMALSMLVSMPIMFLSGVFFPIQTMPPALQGVANVLPVTYAADALRGVMVKGFTLGQVVPDLLVLALFGVFTFTLTMIFFKREIA